MLGRSSFIGRHGVANTILRYVIPQPYWEYGTVISSVVLEAPAVDLCTGRHLAGRQWSTPLLTPIFYGNADIRRADL